jgi:hypothetical protein
MVVFAIGFACGFLAAVIVVVAVRWGTVCGL